jgi:hypothetical protein
MAVKQKQSQKQNVNVNINLGEKKKKKKKRKVGKKQVKRTETQPLIFQTPKQPFNLINAPLPQKQSFVYPEGETASQLGLSSNVSVPFRPNVFREPIRNPTLADEPTIKTKPTKAPKEYSFFSDEPKRTEAENALDYILQFGTSPPTQTPLSDEEIAAIIEAEQKATESEQKASEPAATEQPKKIRGGQKVKEEERLKKETITGITTGIAPVIEQPKKQKKPKKPKEAEYDPLQYPITFPQKVVTAEAIPTELTAEGAYSLTAPLAQQPSAELQQKIVFAGLPTSAEEAEPKKETIQRQRRVIERATPAQSTVWDE